MAVYSLVLTSVNGLGTVAYALRASVVIVPLQ
jgi:hypothetical protein